MTIDPEPGDFPHFFNDGVGGGDDDDNDDNAVFVVVGFFIFFFWDSFKYAFVCDPGSISFSHRR